MTKTDCQHKWAMTNVRDGYLVIGLFQGLYRLDEDTGSDDLLYQDLPPRGVTIIDNAGHPAASRMCTLAEVRRIVRGGSR